MSGRAYLCFEANDYGDDVITSATIGAGQSEFFIRFLTDPGETVLDIFAGSNATGEAADENRRNWIAFERERKYLVASAFRFLETGDENELIETYKKLMHPSAFGVRIAASQLQLRL